MKSMKDADGREFYEGSELISRLYPKSDEILCIAIGGGFAFFAHKVKGAYPITLSQDTLTKSQWMIHKQPEKKDVE